MWWCKFIVVYLSMFLLSGCKKEIIIKEEQIYYTPKTESIKSIFFIDKNTGWSCGKNGIILRTTDGGATWLHRNFDEFDNKLLLNFKVIFDNIYFRSALEGWAIGGAHSTKNNTQDKLILTYYTTDGGINWEKNYASTEYLIYNKNSFLFTNGTGYILRSGRENPGDCDYFYEYLPPSKYELLKTTNKGGTLTQIVLPDTSKILGIDFITSEIGYIAFENSVYKTNDGGNSWQNFFIYNDSDTAYDYGTVGFMNENFGLILRSNYFYKTKNGGASWEKIKYYNSTNGYKGESHNKILFIDESNFLLSNNISSYSYMKTTDGGINFDKLSFQDTGYVYYPYSTVSHTVVDNSNAVLLLRDGNCIPTIKYINLW